LKARTTEEVAMEDETRAVQLLAYKLERGYDPRKVGRLEKARKQIIL
jgi:hypothetical protein